MFELFSEYVVNMGQKVEPDVRAGYTQGLLDKIKDPQEVRVALDQGEPSILSQLIKVGDVEVLRAIVDLCGFKDPLLFLKQPGYLELKLITLHTGANKPEFPGFASVLESIHKVEITGVEARKRYASLVDIYYADSDKTKIDGFKKAIDELLTNGVTEQKIVIPNRKDVKSVTFELVDKIYTRSYKCEALKQVIGKIDLTGKESFVDKGMAIIEALSAQSYFASAVIIQAHAIYRERPEYYSKTYTLLFSKPVLSKIPEGSREQRLIQLLHTEKLLKWHDIYSAYVYSRGRSVSLGGDDVTAKHYNANGTLAEFINKQVLVEVSDFGLKSNAEFLEKFKESPKSRFIKEMYRAAYGEDLGMLLTEQRIDLLLDPKKVEDSKEYSNRLLPERLVAEFERINTGTRKAEFPGFGFVAEEVHKGKLTEKEAVERYKRLVEIYYETSYDRDDFIKAIKEFITTGRIATKVVDIPKRLDITKVLCKLVDDTYVSSYDAEILKQAIQRVDLIGKESFVAQGEAIMANLAFLGCDLSIFTERAKALYMEQPIYNDIKKAPITIPRPAILKDAKGSEEDKLHNLLYMQPKLDWKDVTLPYAYVADGYWCPLSESLGVSKYEKCATIAEFINQQALKHLELKGSRDGESRTIGFIKRLYKDAYGEDLTMVLTDEKAESLLKDAPIGNDPRPALLKIEGAFAVPTAGFTPTKIEEASIGAAPYFMTIEPDPTPVSVTPKGLAVVIASQVVFACAVSQIACMASSRFMTLLPNGVLGMLVNLPTSVKYCGLIAPSVMISGLAVSDSPKVAILVCLGSAASGVISYLNYNEPQGAIITLASVIVTAINYKYSAANEQEGPAR